MKGQQRLPFDEGEHVGRMGQLPLFEMPPDAVPGSSDQPQPSRIVPKTHPGQFQMFMTPREIRANYQALDADRQEAWPDRGGEMTKRPMTTAGEPNIEANTALRKRWAGWHGGTEQVADYKYARNEDYHEESDDELYARKLDESHMEPAEYHELHHGEEPQPPDIDDMSAGSLQPPREPGGGAGTSTWNEYHERDESYHDRLNSRYDRKVEEWESTNWGGPSLHDRIRTEGVQSPVHLSYAQMGQYDKQSVVGGHHRIAAQYDINPDQPIPVSHWRNIQEAKEHPGYT